MTWIAQKTREISLFIVGNEAAVTRIGLYLVAVVSIGLAIWSPSKASDTAILLGIAIAALSINNIAKLKFGDNEIDFRQELDQIKASNKAVAGQLQSVVMDAQHVNSTSSSNDLASRANVAFRSLPRKPDVECLSSELGATQPETSDEVSISASWPNRTMDPRRPPLRDPAKFVRDDPNKGQFGGKPMQNGRKLSAVIAKIGDENNPLCNVKFTVIATDPSRPLTAPVRIYLHPTFGNWACYTLEPTMDSASRTFVVVDHVLSYGVFTIGIETDFKSPEEPATTLELDLAVCEGGSDAFYKN